MASRPLPAGLDPAARLPFVQAVRKPDGTTYLYYRRGGRRTALAGPEGSLAFRRAYEAVHAAHEAAPAGEGPALDGTIGGAIVAYKAGADFRNLAPATKRNYLHYLEPFRARFGALRVAHLDEAWWDRLRDLYAERPGDWNRLRSLMRMVVARYRVKRPRELPSNPLDGVKRIRVKRRSDQNRPWPRPVLLAVLRAATPHFRALVVTYLLTTQRGGDITRFPPGVYDPASRTLTLAQAKTDRALVVHVVPSLARFLDAVHDPDAERLLRTPRGGAWTMANAQETLRRMLLNLRLPRYTLHGLRATGPSALLMEGVPNQAGMALTGHETEAQYRGYTQGADTYLLGKVAAETLERVFGELVAEAEVGGNATRASGVTGRAAAKARRAAEEGVATEVATVKFSSPLSAEVEDQAVVLAGK